MKSSYSFLLMTPHIQLKTTALLFLVSFVTHANPAGQRVSSKVTDVQVSLDGALITQTATFVLKSGNNRVVVDGLAADADLSSLRFAFTQKGISMAGYQLIPRYPRQEDQTPLMRQLGDSIQQIKRRSEEEHLENNVLLQEREMILANKSLGGEGNFSVAELEKLADFYRARLSSIDNRVLQISRRLQKSLERMQGLQRQLDSLSLEFPEQVQQLILELKATESGSTGLKVTYLSKSAHWQPEYELISQGAASSIELKVRARVVQHTGIDWPDVRWTLSTARARGRTEKPVALPWVLRFLQPMTRKLHMYATPSSRSDQPAMSGEALSVDSYFEAAESAERTEQTLNVLFQGKEPLRLPSGAERLLDLEQRELTAQYRHALVPRQDPRAYLIARVVGLTGLSYLPGRTLLYLEQDLVGETTLYFQQNSSDTLDVSLGVDPRVTVQFTAEPPKISENGITNRIERAYKYKLSIQNKHNRPIQVQVDESIPHSAHEDIQVVDVRLDGARPEGEQGLVRWLFDLGSNGEKSIQYSYSLRYPRNKLVGPL
jgi:uncharacterized protein (TIGR02231 family)